MRRFIFGLIFLFCTNVLLAQVNTFPTFLQKLKEIGKIDILAFGDTIMEPNLTDVALKPYLSQISSRLSEVNDCTWQGGRLADYTYYNMDQVIERAMLVF